MAHFLNFPQNSTPSLIGPFLIIGDCVYVFIYLSQLQVADDPWDDANPETFAIISSTIDISIIWHTNSSFITNTHIELCSCARNFMVGNENKQVDILTSFIFNNIIVDDGQVITAVNIAYLYNI